MPGRPRATFRKDDVKRAIAAAREAGFDITGISIGPDGAIRLSSLVGEIDDNPTIRAERALDAWRREEVALHEYQMESIT